MDDATRAGHPSIDWQGLMRTRVVLAHAYHRVDLDLLWAIATDDLPRLADALGPLVEGESS